LEKSVIVDDPDHPDYNGPPVEQNGEGAKPNVSADVSEDMSDLTEKGRILEKLKLFRSFYLLVVVYIYSTRIIVYLFATMLDYQHLWVRHFVVEVITLSFYVVTGYQFRPLTDSPYLSVKREEDVEEDDDNFINERELEMNQL